jgi:hypothetical protein
VVLAMQVEAVQGKKGKGTLAICPVGLWGHVSMLLHYRQLPLFLLLFSIVVLRLPFLETQASCAVCFSCC